MNIGNALNSLAPQSPASGQTDTAMKLSAKAAEKNAAKANKSVSGKSDAGKRFSDIVDNQPSAPSAAKPSDDRDIRSAVDKKTEKSPDVKAEAQDSSKRPKNVTREQALNIFLEKMQNEFGIDAEEVVESFAKLSLDELKDSPEATAKAFVGQLGLDEKDSKKALSMYNELLAMTAAAGLSSYLMKSGQEAQLQVMNKKDLETMRLQRSIGDMSDRFFMTGMHGQEMGAPTGLDRQAKIAQVYGQNMGMDQNPAISSSENAVNPEVQNSNEKDGGMILNNNESWDMNVDGDMLMGLGTGAGAVAAAKAKAASDAAKAAGDSGSAAAQNTSADAAQGLTKDASKNTIESLKAKALAADANATSQAAATNTAGNVSANASANGLSAATAAPLAPLSLGDNSAWSASAGSDDGEERGDQSGDAQLDPAMGLQNGGTNIKGQQVKPFMINTSQATPADVQSNVKEIISQAQYLAKKGGGEMKVSLNPDGLGEMSLRVKMNKGQVNVEMITSSDEAKKVLEKGLGDLKESLASHKLHLDSIKIEAGKDISNQLNQQRDMEQGYQQKFLGDFRDHNQGMKREMFEFGAPNVPKSQTRDQAANTVYGGSAKKRDTSRRLDLVA